MAKGKWEGLYEPRAGDQIGFKAAAADEELLQWIASKQLKRGEMGDFVRDALREKMERERHGLSSDMVQALAVELANRLPVLLASGVPIHAETIGHEVKEALNSLQDATEDLFNNLGIG